MNVCQSLNSQDRAADGSRTALPAETAQGEAAKTTMFYDGGCPLCRREVDHYRRLDVAGQIRWINIDRQPERLEAYGVKRLDGLRRLHVLTAEGQMVRGANAFAAIWSALPYYRHLAALLRWLGALRPLDVCYGLFAQWRFERRLASHRRQHRDG